MSSKVKWLLTFVVGAALVGLLWIVLDKRRDVASSPAAPSAHSKTAAKTVQANDGDEPSDDAIDDVDELLEEPPPLPPASYRPAERPERTPLSPEENRARQTRAVSMLNAQIERLEVVAARLESEGDAKGSEKVRRHVARLRKKRDERKKALDEAEGRP